MAITRSTRRASAYSAGLDAERPSHRTTLSPQRRIAGFRQLAIAVTAAIICSAPYVADAQVWRIVPSVALESTFTDNVNLASGGERRADWINQITPTVRFSETGAHTRFAGSIGMPILVYARESGNNYVAPQIAIAGTVEAVEKFLFVDTSANVSQQYITPFGARPNNLASVTGNRYTAQSYAVTPYIRGVLPNNLSYELRDSNTWGTANGVGNGSGGSYSNQLTGHLTRAPVPFGWSIDYDRSELHGGSQPTETVEIGRARALYLPDPSVRLEASVGYEDNRFALTQERGVTYGVGGGWRPSDRTNLEANWEHRFFGSAYRLTFGHRTPLTVWSVSATRDLTNYPSQLATLAAGGDVNALLNSLLSSRVPDPVQRQQLVDRFVRDRGLPTQLQGPLPLFAQQTTLVESQIATFGILGVRNSVLFTAFRSRNRPVEGSESSDLNDVLVAIADSSQVGTTAIWTHQIASNSAWAMALTYSRATSHREPRETTDQYQVSSTLTRRLSPFTSLYGGIRFQDFRPDIAQGYREFAILFGVSYTFH